MGLASTKLGGAVEDGARLDSLAREAPQSLGGKLDQALREVGAGEELLRLHVDLRRVPLPHLIEVDREL